MKNNSYLYENLYEKLRLFWSLECLKSYSDFLLWKRSAWIIWSWSIAWSLQRRWCLWDRKKILVKLLKYLLSGVWSRNEELINRWYWFYDKVRTHKILIIRQKLRKLCKIWLVAPHNSRNDINSEKRNWFSLLSEDVPNW